MRFKNEVTIIVIAWTVWLWLSVLSFNTPPPPLRSPNPAIRLIEERDGENPPQLLRGKAITLVMRLNPKLIHVYCSVSVDMRPFVSTAWRPEERLLPGRYELKLTDYEMNARILALECRGPDGDQWVTYRQLLTPRQPWIR